MALQIIASIAKGRRVSTTFIRDIPLCYDNTIYKICISHNTTLFIQQILHV